MFKKLFGKNEKSELEKMIDADGIEHAAKRFAEIISRKLPTKEIAYQFILEEIEAASQGNAAAINFAKESGIGPDEYSGAMNNSIPEIDGADGPQQLLLQICSQLMSNTDLMVELRTKITDNIMQQFSLGKYDLPSNSIFSKILQPKESNSIKLENIVSRNNQTGSIFVDIINGLGESVETIMEHSKLIQMTYGYARRAAATALYIQGIIDKDVFDHNLAFFKAIQVKTEHTVEFQEQAFSDAIDYMQTYNPIITRLLIKNMAPIAQSFTPPQEILSDAELIEIVMDAYAS